MPIFSEKRSLMAFVGCHGLRLGVVWQFSKETCNHMAESRILYCHCAYAKVVPEETKEQVLERLSDSGVAFEAVADLCEMSARKDPALKRLAEGGALKVAACYPRAVRWLFQSADANLNGNSEILNMRDSKAGEVCRALLEEEGKVEESVA